MNAKWLTLSKTRTPQHGLLTCPHYCDFTPPPHLWRCIAASQPMKRRGILLYHETTEIESNAVVLHLDLQSLLRLSPLVWYN
jgi:hypothetical protein